MNRCPLIWTERMCLLCVEREWKVTARCRSGEGVERTRGLMQVLGGTEKNSFRNLYSTKFTVESLRPTKDHCECIRCSVHGRNRNCVTFLTPLCVSINMCLGYDEVGAKHAVEATGHVPKIVSSNSRRTRGTDLVPPTVAV